MDDKFSICEWIRELLNYQNSPELARTIYGLTVSFPIEEMCR
jgi:hypothetical protein